MGTTQSSSEVVDFKKKLFIVIDLYFKPKFDNSNIFDIEKYKNSDILKKNVKDIILNSLTNKGIYKVSLSDNNIILIYRKDNNNIKYLELNAILEFYDYNNNSVKTEVISSCIPSYISPKEIISKNVNSERIETIKLHILSELFKYVSNDYGIIIEPNLTLVLLANTLNNIEIYQK